MNFDWTKQLSFRQAIWLFPIAFTLHVAEEICCFTAWAQKFASPEFTFENYLQIHLLGIVSAFLAAFVLRYFQNKLLILLFFALMFAPAVFWNVFFHAGATVYFGEYCPGLLSALIIYPPTFYLITREALRERLLSKRNVIFGLIFAGIFHFFEVGHNVFKLW